MNSENWEIVRVLRVLQARGFNTLTVQDALDKMMSDEGLPPTYAEVDYGDRLDNDPEAILGARFDDMNYRHYTER